MKLSTPQARALGKLEEMYAVNPAMRHSAYDLGESLSTLNALVKMGLAEKRSELGSMAFPRSSIFFRWIKR